MNKPMSGRIALVTGANRGIGVAIAREYGRAGAQCLLAGRNLAELERVAQDIRSAGGDAQAIAMDLERPESIAGAIDRVVKAVPRLDVFVANAASLGAREPLVKYPLEVWRQSFQVNVHANVQLLQGLDALLRKSAAARVIILSALVAVNAKVRTGSYAATKAALEAVARIYGIESRDSSITVNLVGPGATRTTMRARAAPEEDPMTIKTPEDIAPMFVEIASPAFTQRDAWLDADEWLKAKRAGK